MAFSKKKISQRSRGRPKGSPNKNYKKKTSKTPDDVDSYTHRGKTRKNTPHVGLVDSAVDPDLDPATYSYSPHLDPAMNWAGKKAEDFEIPTVSLHIHERIDTATIIKKVLKKETYSQQTLSGFFEQEENNPPLDKAIQFYQHPNNWSNRFIAGDSLLIMNSLLKKEDLSGKVQMAYIDPPYGIKYGSNFQPFVCKKEVKDRDDDLAYTPETIRAFRDTWELGIHSYLSYLRDRLILARELLQETGSCAVQISDDNMHYVRMLMDEVFGSENFVGIIQFQKIAQSTSSGIPIICDYIIWYAKYANRVKYNKMYMKKPLPINDPNFKYVELSDGTRRSMTKEERANPLTVPYSSRIYRHANITSGGKSTKEDTFEFEGEKFNPGPNLHWIVTLDGMKNLAKQKRLVKRGNILSYIRFFDDFVYREITNMWTDTSSGGFENKIYVVQTTAKTIARFMLMTTDPGDLVFDPTCGSGTTAFVAEQYGRRWITCDTQRVAITLAKRRLMTANFKYYELRYPEQGIGSGFLFTAPDGIAEKVTPKALAHNEEFDKITLHDRPDEDKKRTRVSGPFTVEAVPSPTVTSVDALHGRKIKDAEPDKESTRQEEWRTALRYAGIRVKGGERIEFIDVRPHPVSRWFHAEAKTNRPESEKVLISFGPQYGVLDPRQVEAALQEVRMGEKKPDILVFASMQFDPEAARIIDEIDWPKIQIVKAQINPDLLVGDLKKKDRHADSFVLVGQPDASLVATKDGKYTVEIMRNQKFIPHLLSMPCRFRHDRAAASPAP